jgi:hypothetical protein
MIDVLLVAVDEFRTRLRESGWRQLRGQNWLIMVGTFLLLEFFGAVVLLRAFT